MTIALLFAILVTLLQVGDWYTTRTILARGGRELNPVIKWLMGRFGVDGVLIVKGSLLSAGAFVAADYSYIAPALLSALYVWVVLHNYKVLKTLPKA